MKTKKTNTRGFTIVELLTVMAVIAVLIGLLIPALALVKDNAKKIQQSAQFHGIDVGLELFKSEFGAYPESFDNLGTNTPTLQPPLSTRAYAANYGGSQKLAEALVGWDLLGYHPKSGFRSDGWNYFPDSGAFTASYQWVYDATNGLDVGSYVEADGNANIKARTGPLLDLENANAYRMYDVYGTATGTFDADNIVLCDVYAKKRTSGEKTGMPILYFRANTNYTLQNYYGDGAALGDGSYLNDVYNYEDNDELIALQTAESIPVQHEIEISPTADRFENFEKYILNQQVVNASGVYRPYRATSYILISAGKDGNYGTADDITNFGAKVTE